MKHTDDVARLLARIAQAPSPFYRARLAERADFARIPLTQRTELLTDQLDHLPLGTRRFADAAHPVRLGITGTGDTLLVLAWSAADLARERAAGARLFGTLGVRAGMRVANTLPGALATPGSLLLGDVIEEIRSPAEGYVLSYPHHGNHAAASGDIVAFIAPRSTMHLPA